MIKTIKPVPTILLAILLVAVTACAQKVTVIYVTATPPLIGTNGQPVVANPLIPTPTPSSPTALPIQPTPNPPPPANDTPIPYTVQQGDTLNIIAANFGTDTNQILALNPDISTTTTILAGQTLLMPAQPSFMTPNFKIIPDSELVNSPAASHFDVDAYVKFQPGFIRIYSEDVADRRMSGIDIINFIATSTSVNPRLLLALLEYRGGWVSNPVPSPDAINYPMGFKDPNNQGLFKQLSRATDALNGGYYDWKQRGMGSLQFPSKKRLAYAPQLNAGTIGVQNFLAQTTSDLSVWEHDVSSAGFFTTYMSMFGDPFRNAIEPLIPPDLKQPDFSLPFAQNEVWYFTAGPHGGWDRDYSGWAAIDFAPPKPPDSLVAAQGQCYVSPDIARAIVGGLVVRSGDGAVVIDVDMDGDERTGWTVIYLHMADQDRVPAGTVVQPGSPIGHPSCEGFDLVATATHLHIARRYNGEWIAADCPACVPASPAPPFVLGGWRVRGLGNLVYQGTLENGTQIRHAQQGRDDPTNQISW